MGERDQFLGQIEKLVNSQSLHGSESLCKLLRYLAKHALGHPGEPLKEFQIATEVFARSPDFDPQLDSMVRVQAGRLRTKLAEYYTTVGAEDPILVELPKGSYVLSFHHRVPAADKGASTGNEPASTDARKALRKWAVAVAALSVLLAAAVATIVVQMSPRRTPDTLPAGGQGSAPAAFQVFWKGFSSGPEEPWVIFSNAAFAGRPESGMRYYNASRDKGALILDHYTGVGEVLAIHELDQVFALMHRQLRVKRGSLFSLDDAKSNDLIFIGSPSENLTLLEIPGTQEFVFQRMDSGPRKGDLGIINVHPLRGESQAYFPTPSNQPLTEDYAVIGLVRGMNPSRSVLILAGTTTIGTQAAVEYICRQNSMEELLQRLSVSDSSQLKPFEAVLRVQVTRGVPVASELVALRK